MNTSAAPAWSQPAHADSMVQMTASDLDDLGNLFEFGDIDLNGISNVDPSAFGEQLQHASNPQHSSHPGSPFGDMSAPSPLPTTSAHDFSTQEQFALGLDQHMQQQQQQIQRPTQYLSRENSQGPTSNPYGNPEAMYKSAVRQPYPSVNHPHQFQYQSQPQYPPVQHVPPTPNSYEMHGETGRFMQQQQQQHMEQQRTFALRKDDATAYTPMVSPAGTPQFPVQPEYTTPGAYFSPLTSPMMYAQQQISHQQQQQQRQPMRGYYANPSTAPSSAATSPIEPNADIEMLDEMALPEPANKKVKRKPASTARNAAANRIKQSPIQKPQKRKSTLSSSAIAGKGPSDLLNQVQKPSTLHPNQYGTNPSSEEGSISPEPLSESVMGPPPRPGSAVAPSPVTRVPRGNESGSIASAAATPKSILSMRGLGTGSSVMSEGGLSELGGLEDLHLPEAAAGNDPRRASLNRINTNVSSIISSGENTPRLRKTPKIGADSTPSSSGRPGSARPTSALASPSLSGSPVVGSTPAGLLQDKKDAKGPRSAKKRGSMGASVSPAIRPRISPSIKPLLPEGSSLHSPTHALLLASKSNYQNLLEGNHLPGVNYPDSLSTGLTSKRTSHKVAEQGRRNRINEALKEMQALLPKPSPSSKAAKESANESSPSADAAGEAESKDAKDDANAKSNSSKAATVESANKYIRELQKENAEKTANLLQLQMEHAEMRKKLAAHESGDTSTNDDDDG